MEFSISNDQIMIVISVAAILTIILFISIIARLKAKDSTKSVQTLAEEDNFVYSHQYNSLNKEPWSIANKIHKRIKYTEEVR